MVRFVARHLQTAALSRMVTILLGHLLWNKTNSSFRECGHAALVEADGPQRAESYER
jgi:hypothetical protein